GWKQIDLIDAQHGDSCPSCLDGTLRKKTAIEVAHTFYLGKKYSVPLDAAFKTARGQQEHFEMGCYGIGVSRLIAAVAEASRDADGLVWPRSIAPYSAVVVPALSKSTGAAQSLERVQDLLAQTGAVDATQVVLDDRDVSFGFKMKDALLVGYPTIVVAGKRFLEEGLLEVHDRKTKSVRFLTNVRDLKLDTDEKPSSHEQRNLKRGQQTPKGLALRSLSRSSAKGKSSPGSHTAVAIQAIKKSREGTGSRERGIALLQPSARSNNTFEEYKRMMAAKAGAAKPQEITITIGTIMGKMISVTLWDTDTVAALKDHIAGLEGIAPDSQMLVFCDTHLVDDQATLKSLSIQDQSSLQLILKMAG
ncbi:hypothetical protein HDU91_003432, partial [Kappamyces sp. JEL0680]